MQVPVHTAVDFADFGEICHTRSLNTLQNMRTRQHRAIQVTGGAIVSEHRTKGQQLGALGLICSEKVTHAKPASLQPRMKYCQSPSAWLP